MIHGLLAIATIAWMNNGLFTYVMPFVPAPVRYALFLTWLLIAILSDPGFLRRLGAETYPLVVFILYLSIISGTGGGTKADNAMSSFLYLFIIYAIFLFYADRTHTRTSKCMIAFLVLDLAFLAVNTYFALKTDPMIARYLATERAAEISSLTDLRGLGGYAYFYSLVPLALLLLHLGLRKPTREFHFILLAAALVLLLVDASYTMALVLLVAFALVIVLRRLTTHVSIAVISALSAACALLLTGAAPRLLARMADAYWWPEVVSVRLTELSHFLAGNLHIGSDLQGRFSLYSRSLGTFLSSPIFGVAGTTQEGLGVGGHSAWLDNLALFGIMSMLAVHFFAKAYRFSLPRVPVEHRGFFNIFWSYFALLGFLNTLFFSSIFTAWLLLLPLLLIAQRQGVRAPDTKAEDLVAKPLSSPKATS